MSSVDMSQYGRAGSAYKFENTGDTLAGTVSRIREPFEQTNSFTGNDETVMTITIETDDGEEWSLWPRLQPYSALGGAISKAVGTRRLEVGGRLSVTYTEDRDIGKPQPMKDYAATYEPPRAGVKLPSAVDDDRPF